MVQLPAEYQDLSPEAQYSQGFSETRRLETYRSDTLTRREEARRELHQMEQKLNITTRWTPTTPEYMKTLSYIRNRTYQAALNHLQRLLVKRLFELHHLNIAGLGM